MSCVVAHHLHIPALGRDEMGVDDDGDQGQQTGHQQNWGKVHLVLLLPLLCSLLDYINHDWDPAHQHSR